MTNPVIILHAAGHDLRTVRALRGPAGVELSGARTFVSASSAPDQPDEMLTLKDPTVLDALVKHVYEQGWGGCDAVVLVGGNATACHYFEMPALPEKALAQAVRLKLSQQLHFPLASAVVAHDVAPLARGPQERQALVRAAVLQKDVAWAAVDAVERCGLNLRAIAPACVALAELSMGMSAGGRGLQAFLHVDERAGTLVVLRDGRACVTSELTISLADFTAALMRPIIQDEKVLQLDEIRAAALRDEVGIPVPGQHVCSLGIGGERLLPLLEPVLQKFVKQINQWLMYASTCAGGGRVGRMTLVGPAVAMPGLAQALKQRASMEVECACWVGAGGEADRTSADAGPQSLTIAMGAAHYWTALPDLTPPEVHRRRCIQRVRRWTAMSAPAVAAVLLALACLFDGLGADVAGRVAAHQQLLAEVSRTVASNRRWQERERAVAALQGQFSEFAWATPRWLGVFKELSQLLPTELKATEYVARSSLAGVKLTVTAMVYTAPAGRSFDEIAGQTLLLLQRSAFFKRVELVLANRGPQPSEPDAAGLLAVELDLVYPHSRQRG